MKKILFIVEAMGGGVFTYIVDMANELVNYYDMYIAYSVRNQTPDNYKEYFDKRVQLIRVKNFERSIKPVKDIKSVFEVRRIAKKIHPDLIHLHSSKAGVIGRLAFSGKSTPLFYTPHGYSFLMQSQSRVKRSMYRLIEAVCGKKRCITVCCSEGEYLESLMLTKKTVYINNGINIREIQEFIHCIKISDHKSFMVFTLGRICAQKNPKLFNAIAESMPDIRFVWIGDGELRDELKATNVEITGWVERKRAIELSMQGDVFLLTSLWEGLPISLLEAMYMKKLCVVSDAIGNRDVIHSGINGFVCREVEDFRSAIMTALNGRANDLIERAYQDIMETYNVMHMVEKYKMLYESVGISTQSNTAPTIS